MALCADNLIVVMELVGDLLEGKQGRITGRYWT